ncbi:MAG: GNVR domain-containing protein, partial [Candidatus Omnitrophota bacterium]
MYVASSLALISRINFGLLNFLFYAMFNEEKEAILPQYELNLRDYLRIFHKRKLSIIITFIAVMVLVIAYLSKQPVYYKASATVKIEERKTIAGLLTEWIIYTPADTMESQAKIIRGYSIMKKVALRLGMINEDSPLPEVNKAVSRVQGSIETERIERTNIIRIVSTADTPKEAMDLANTVAEVYIEENLLEKTKQARHTRQFIEEQLASLEGRLKQTEERLRQFGDEVKSVRLAEPIQKKLIELEFQLSELLQKYTEKHPRIIQLREQIQEMEKQTEGFSEQELEYARLSREVEVNKKLYAMLKEKLEEARISEAEKVPDITIVDPAVLPTAPISVNKQIGILVGGMMGLILGIAFAFVKETLDTSIGTMEDVEAVVKLPVLGVVPSIGEKVDKTRGIFLRLTGRMLPTPRKSEEEERSARLVTHYLPSSPAAEAFRNIRTNLKLNPSKKTILITSSGPREGKTTIMTNLGIAIAQTGAKTLLISSDLRRPALAKTFGIDREPGFSELLNGTVTLEQALRSVADIMLGEMKIDEIIARPPGIDNIWILTSGKLPFNPAEVLESKELDSLIEEFKRRFDVILFDSPPVLPVTDASLLAPKLDSTVIVYEIGRTSRDALMRAKTQLESMGGKISGVILNHTQPQTEAIVPYPYYYKYKYRYYGKEEP